MVGTRLLTTTTFATRVAHGGMRWYLLNLLLHGNFRFRRYSFLLPYKYSRLFKSKQNFLSSFSRNFTTIRN
jgi:hypothetical protein